MEYLHQGDILKIEKLSLLDLSVRGYKKIGLYNKI